MTVVRAAKALDSLKLKGDEAVGVKIIKRALSIPLQKIAENAGWEGPVVERKVVGGKANFGFDAERERYCDLVEAGIVDPTKVTRTALQNAASVAGILLTTGCIVCDIPEEEKGMPGMPPGGMGGGMPGMGGMGGGMPGMGGMGGGMPGMM